MKTVRLIAALMALILLMSLAACNTNGNDGKVTDGTEDNKPDTTVTEGDSAVITSPGGDLSMRIYKNDKGDVVYTLEDKSENGAGEIIGESAMGVKLTDTDGFSGCEIVSCETRLREVTFAYLGPVSLITDKCTAAKVKLRSGDYDFYIEVKMYDNGTAFRYNMPSVGKTRTVSSESTAFRVNNISKVWYGSGSDCYESEIRSSPYSGVTTSAKLNAPLTIELKSGKGYVVLAEGFVDDSYIGTNYVSTGKNNTFKISGSWDARSSFEKFKADGDVRTGWRMINFAPDLAGIVCNYNIYSSALDFDSDTAPDADRSWIVPGKSTWSWINDGRVPFDPQIDYTVNCAKLGFTYNIIDEGYTNWTDSVNKLKDLGTLANELNVKQILWCAVTPGHSGYQIDSPDAAAKMISRIASYNISGIKLDFFNSETKKETIDIEKASLKEAAKNNIIIDFHGVHAPISLSVLYPNELTREGIRGLENGLRGNYTTQASYIVNQFYTRMLAGHADFTPDVNTAMQIASLVVLDSPLTVIATDPDDILANEACEMIKAIPTVWDNTVFLDGSIGSYVSVARENNGVWYVGGIASASARDAEIDCSKFLGEGEYMLTLWKDKSPNKKEKIEKTVTAGDKISIGSLSAGCGYVAMFTKLDMSYHGGEINGPLTIKTASPSSVVKYTTDGSDPVNSASAVTYESGINLTESCTLRAAIVSGDGEGSEMSYTFNTVKYNRVKVGVDYSDGETTVTLSSTLKDGVVYYTTDGSTPTASSEKYTSPLSIKEAVTIKAISVSSDGESVSSVVTEKIIVRTTVKSIKPDVYLGKNYIEAVAGWDNRIMVDESMNHTTISLGGTNASDGTKFAHGISTNAIGYFVYAIPENATRFVGVAGIDDSAFNNTGEGHKASIECVIYIDDVQVYKTAKLGQGGYEQIDVTIPEGASQIKIYFTDAGDGITCDNASLADGGFIY